MYSENLQVSVCSEDESMANVT